MLEAKIDHLLETQFAAGRLYAAISSRPGQSGRADGYILEGKELEVGESLILLAHYSLCLVLLEKNQDWEAEACSCLIGTKSLVHEIYVLCLACLLQHVTDACVYSLSVYHG